MKRLLLAMMVLGSAPALNAQTDTSRVEPSFPPAEARSVTDIPAAILCTVTGTVVLDALVTETGEVQAVEIRRDVACLTQLAVQAVKDWKFSPATFAGKAIASRMPVAVTFEPAPPPYDNPAALSTLIPQSAAAIQAAFQPAEVTRAAFQTSRPWDTVVAGAVVLEVTLSAKGETEETKVLRDLPPFTAGAKAGVEDWRFMPAAFNGHPVRSKILLAFVYPPVISKPVYPAMSASCRP